MRALACHAIISDSSSLLLCANWQEAFDASNLMYEIPPGFAALFNVYEVFLVPSRFATNVFDRLKHDLRCLDDAVGPGCQRPTDKISNIYSPSMATKRSPARAHPGFTSRPLWGLHLGLQSARRPGNTSSIESALRPSGVNAEDFHFYL